MAKKRELTRLDLLGMMENGAVPYVKQFLTDHGFKIMPDMSIRNEKGNVVAVSEVVVDLRLTHFADRNMVRVINKMRNVKEVLERVPNEVLEGALDKILFAARDGALGEMVTQTEHDASIGDSHLRAFLAAVIGKEDEFLLKMLQHWLANVKRRMRGEPVKFQMFPVLVGAQGGGKTTALRMLLKPIRWYVMDVNSLQALSDERNFKAISEKYVAVLDEMARSDKTDAQMLKNLITADTMSARVLGTNRRDLLIANCSFVGTSNIDVNSLIYDPSGMRRFIEFKCLDLLDWNALEKVDYLAVWRSIDTEEDYLRSVKHDLNRHQEAIREPSQAEVFVDEVGLRPGEVDNESHRCTNIRLYEMYRMWAERSGRKNTMDARTLGKAVNILGFKPWKTKYSRGRWVEVLDGADLGGTFAEKALDELEALEGRPPLVRKKN